MSLLSDTSLNVLEAVNSVRSNVILANSFPGKVLVAQAVLDVASAIAASVTPYELPLSIPIPDNAVVFRVIYDVTEAVVTSNANTISLGLNSNTDIVNAAAVAAFGVGVSEQALANVLVAQNPNGSQYDSINLLVGATGNLTAGYVKIRLFFM